jgi:hypothetical protein
VLGGMIAATLLGIFFVPLFFVVIRERFKKRTPNTPSTTDTLPAQND